MVAPLTDGPVHRPFRFGLVRLILRVLAGVLFRVRVEGREHLTGEPVIYCANHLNWVDPLILLTVLPVRPKIAMLGPKEADMTKGGRNRLIVWAGFGVPYRPEKTDLLEMARRVQRVLDDGWALFVFGEGRIHRGERELLPLAAGSAFFALRAGVPVVPIAINGTSWLGWGRRSRIRVGEPIRPEGKATHASIEALTARTEEALLAMVADFPDRRAPGPVGRWFTEVFNDWPEGARPEAGEGDGAGTDLASRRARGPAA